VLIIIPDGLFHGERLRKCSNEARYKWPYIYLSSNGYARLEINYNRIAATAFAGFRPVPTEEEVGGCIREYHENHLLFIYEAAGQLWGQWDTPAKALPRYKTAGDRNSPAPPEPAFSEWKKAYRHERRAFPKSFGNISETFPHAVAVADAGAGAVADVKLDYAPGTRVPSHTGELCHGPALRHEGYSCEPGEAFDRFWEKYPRKTGKAMAVQVWLSLELDAIADQVMAGLDRWLRSEEWEKDNGKYIPSPAKWLSEKRWLDDPKPADADLPEYWR
jgi:hypothetical protein